MSKTTCAFLGIFIFGLSEISNAGQLYAGVAKTEISNRAGSVNDLAFVKALILKKDSKLVSYFGCCCAC